MRCVTFVARAGGRGFDVAVATDRPAPRPEGRQVLVRVHGAGLNRADLLQQRGAYPAPPGVPADVPGLEFAGVVEAVGGAVGRLRPGDRVAGIVGGGGQAELVLTDDDACVPVPDALDLVTAGGVPEVFVTAHDALFTRGGLAPGERVLVHGVGSGVGTAAVQLARAVGATVVGTARTAVKLQRAEALGLDHGVLVGRELDAAAVVDAVRAVTGGGVDVVIDLVGGPYLGVDVAACAPLGRIVLVGTLAGARAELDILGVMGKRLAVHGTVLRARAPWEKAAALSAFAAQVNPLLASGAVRPVIDAVLPITGAAAAYELLASDTTFGKVVLDCR